MIKPVPPIAVGIVAVGVGAASFFGGMKFEQYHTSKNRMNVGFFQQGQGAGQMTFIREQGGTARQGGGNAMFGGRLLGEIVSLDDKSLTIKLPDGSTKIVLLSDSTKIQETTDTSKDKLKTGSQIAAFGKTNTDGSVTADSIQLNPEFGRMGAGGGNGTPVASPSNQQK